MNEINLDSWESFEEQLKELDKKRLQSKSKSKFLYRGQENQENQEDHTNQPNKLSSTLERNGQERMTIKEYHHLISVVKPQIESFAGGNWNILPYPSGIDKWLQENDTIMPHAFGWSPEFQETYSYMVFLRHYGFPSPMIDWTSSPYVGAYFAFRRLSLNIKKVSIYVFLESTSEIGMNYPAASRGVSERSDRIPSEEPELLRMKLGVLLLPALLDDVALDLPFAPVAADRANVEPIRPELPTPEILLDRRHPVEDLPSRETLDDPDQLRGAVRRDRLDQEVHVVPICSNLEEDDVIPFGDLQADVSQDRIHLGREHGPPVLRRTDEVVQQNGDIVAAVDVLTHPSSLSQPDAASRGESTLLGLKSGSSNEPGIYRFGPYVKTDRRHFIQQSLYTICILHDGEWRYVPHEEAFTRNDQSQDVLWKLNIPYSERLKVLKLLDSYNINALSLFGSTESLMETMALREINFRDKEL